MKKMILFMIVLVLSTYCTSAAYSGIDISNFMSSIKSSQYVNITSIGQSAQRRPIYAVVITDFKDYSDKEVFAFITRQHGSEWAGNAVVEGMINELIENPNLIYGKEFHFIINANPDGIAKNKAGNSVGINLNHVWNLPDLLSWETKYTRRYITNLHKSKGIDTFIDIHGYNGAETQSEIVYQSDKSKNACNNIVSMVPEFKCHYATSSTYTSKWYAQNKLKVPVVLTIEPLQKTVSWSNSKYEEFGRKMVVSI